MTDRGTGQEGAVAVEFAIIFPLLAMILFGVIQFGTAWSKVQVFEGAAREGARCAAVQGAEAAAGLPVCDIQSAINQAAGSYTPSANAVVSVSGGGSQCTAATVGQDVTVSWDQTLELNIPFWSNVTLTRNVKGTFRCE